MNGTIKGIAEGLNGREYGDELTDDESKHLAGTDFVVMFGCSDDLVRIEGGIYDEVSAYEGVTVYLNGHGLIENDCDNEDCPCYRDKIDNAKNVEALWCDEDEYSWTFKTDIPHATFDIMEDGEKFCRGIVFSLNCLN